MKALLPITILAAGLLAGGCGVYVPVLPHTPLAQHKGEVEASAYANLAAGQVNVAYSPLNHLVVTSGGSLSLGRGYSWYARQGEVGLGTYAVSDNGQWFIYGLGGYGGTAVSKVNNEAHGPKLDYESRYHRYFSQVHGGFQVPGVVVGLAVRVTSVDYTRLTLNEAAIVAPSPTLYWEPTGFIRLGNGPVQMQGTLGISGPLQSGFPSTSLAPRATIMGVGVVIRPHRFGRNTATD
ncbi:hypothetical protein LJY25_14545 [Hymenobacter sp. BT175]|uniref:hypothetical protein n=1 Tax=Hymenobacter translucens TaxID=2886507 RepID=UPI001D0E3989|nr:hypothetical protein [Hymenobacter translucens]MCC2547671.1 hypothetical protein [Hymenobacter translucens]